MNLKPNYPFEEGAKRAEEFAAKGHKVYQKFTCGGCGQRLTIDIPNTFYAEGACDKCDHITDIRKVGCNFVLVMNTRAT